MTDQECEVMKDQSLVRRLLEYEVQDCLGPAVLSMGVAPWHILAVNDAWTEVSHATLNAEPCLHASFWFPNIMTVARVLSCVGSA